MLLSRLQEGNDEMKVAIASIGLLVGGIATAYLLFAPAKTLPLPERPDPNFDYYNASFEDKTKWMQKFAALYVVVLENTKASIERAGTAEPMNSSLKIDPNKRQLTITLTPVKPKPTDSIRLGTLEKKVITDLAQVSIMSDCKAAIKRFMIVKDTSIVLKIKTHLTHLPTLSVTLSKESCRKFLELNQS